MTQKNLKTMSNSELLTRFMTSRDNLVHFRLSNLQCPNDTTISNLLDLEQSEYAKLKEEIYRRMNK